MTEVPPPPPAAPVPPTFEPAPQGGKGMAIASLVLGIVSLALCLYWFVALPAGIVAVVLGVIARGKGVGKGLALGGIITGAIGVLFGIILAIFSFAGGGFIEDICADQPDNPYCEQQGY